MFVLCLDYPVLVLYKLKWMLEMEMLDSSNQKKCNTVTYEITGRTVW